MALIYTITIVDFVIHTMVCLYNLDYNIENFFLLIGFCLIARYAIHVVNLHHEFHFFLTQSSNNGVRNASENIIRYS